MTLISQAFLLSLLIVTLLVSTTTPAMAKKKLSISKPEDSSQIENKNHLDNWQNNVSKRLFRLSNRIDSYFGNVKNLEEKNGTNLQIYTLYTHEEQGHGYNDLALKFRLRLPNLEDKIQLSFELGEDDPNDAFEDAETRKNTNQNDFSRAGLNFFNPTKYVNLKLTLGWEMTHNPQGFARLKSSKDYYVDTLIYYWNFEILQRFKDGRDYDFDFYISRPYTSHFYFRFKNSWAYNENKHLLTGQHGPQWVYTFSNRLSFHSDLLAQTTNEPTHHASSYHLVTGTRFNMYKDFLFGEISPSLNFYRARRFKGLAALSFKLEILFGDY